MRLCRSIIEAMKLLGLGVVGSFSLYGAPQSFGCLEELIAPKYPPLARQARLQGTVEVRVDLRDRTTPTTTITGTHALLRSAVADALEGSRFQRACAEGEFKIVFLFEMDLSAPPRAHDEGTVIIRWPGTVVVRARRFPLSGSSIPREPDEGGSPVGDWADGLYSPCKKKTSSPSGGLYRSSFTFGGLTSLSAAPFIFRSAST